MASRNSYPKISYVRWHDGRTSNEAPHRTPKVIFMDGVTRLDIDPDRVLAGAIGKLHDAVVIGRGNAGKLYVASSMADGGDLLWLLEQAKQELFAVASQLEDDTSG